MAYTIRQLVDLGLINSPYATINSEASNYVYIVKEIQSGRLKATHIGNGKIRNRYLISKENISEYLENYR